LKSAEVTLDHLLPDVASTLAWPVEKRIEQIWSDSFVPYPAAEQIIEKIERLRSRPRTIRPQNLLITGPPGNGKSAILNEFLERNPEQFTPEVTVKPVVIAEVPAGAGEGRLLGSILRRLGYSEDWDKGSTDLKTRKVLNTLKRCRVEILGIDEVNNLMEGGKMAWESLRTLKEISNELGLPIVFAGTEEALVVLREDTQLTTRVDAMRLRPWEYGNDFCRLLCNLESTLSVAHPSRLYSREKAALILDLTASLNPRRRKGILFDIIKLVKTSAELVVRDGSEIIGKETLTRVADNLASDWKIESDRLTM
jgi:ribosomal protein S8